ncbi:proteasome subunit alpha type-1 isoform X1 [Poecile atricapillus]|uniref:proteasome subunit alpha type-1 isoform X1 n=1 Tax=Poecile atricapillus TaxID=48891 RepID=UPI0027388EF9|nr:proteasome subunit alpha type-1 isoform X1 [Poecile atricapillus]
MKSEIHLQPSAFRPACRGLVLSLKGKKEHPEGSELLPPKFRNQYDNDVTVWSPQGRIHQIEYAMEAVKQGSATVGLKSKTHAVLVALKRAQSELAAHQKKILYVDNHIGISIAGLTADARLLCNFMRQECLDSRFVFDRPLPVSRLVSLIGSKTQIPTQRYGRRPYGVGLLIAGYDDMGPHIFQTCPSANYFDCKAMSIGARSQSARTYLERHMTEFTDCNLNELVKHGLRALRETLPAEQDLTTKNVSIGIVGKDMEFTIYDDDDVAPFLEGLEERPQRKPVPPVEETVEKAEEPMEH